jgi:hypothetical protein
MDGAITEPTRLLIMWIWTDKLELVNTTHLTRVFLVAKQASGEGPWDVRAELVGGSEITIENADSHKDAEATLKYLGENLLAAGDPING